MSLSFQGIEFALDQPVYHWAVIRHELLLLYWSDGLYFCSTLTSCWHRTNTMPWPFLGQQSSCWSGDRVQSTITSQKWFQSCINCMYDMFRDVLLCVWVGADGLVCNRKAFLQLQSSVLHLPENIILLYYTTVC